jgi:2-polyprenyl-6-methoxyphenol hydroxylase-like FAD-dependent oxidoreductase
MAGTGNVATATRIIRRTGHPSARHVSADLCVVGAGIAGISAAVEAARLGRKVVLIDGLPTLGGQAVNSIVGTFCGLFANGTHGRQLTHGIADDILRELGARKALHYRHGPVTTVVMYDEVALSRWIEEEVRRCSIQVVLGAILREVTMSGRRVAALDLATRHGDVRITATGFVDASGDAVLAWQAGLPCRVAADGPIYGTQMVVLEGVNETDYPAREVIAARLKERAKAHGLTRDQGFAFPFPGRGIALVNLTHVETPLDPIAATTRSLEGRTEADKVVEFLKNEFPTTFAPARVRSYGQLGIRQTRWIAGRYHLTVDEVRAGKRFDDAIARTGWPIELHDTPQGYIWEPFGEDHLHYVPFGSLVSPDADNLVAAGRCIDGDTAALSSVRVMGPCIAMGAAAAHALDLAGSGSVHQLDAGALRKRLYDNLDRSD